MREPSPLGLALLELATRFELETAASAIEAVLDLQSGQVDIEGELRKGWPLAMVAVICPIFTRPDHHTARRLADAMSDRRAARECTYGQVVGPSASTRAANTALILSALSPSETISTPAKHPP